MLELRHIMLITLTFVSALIKPHQNPLEEQFVDDYQYFPVKLKKKSLQQ